MFTKTLKSNLALASLIALGCAKQNDSSVNYVTTHFSMTGSSQTATVAKSNLEKFLSRLIPSAQALTPPVMMDSMGNTVTMTQAWVSVKEVEFKAEETGSETESAEIQFQGPYYVDLLSPTPSELDSAQLPDQVYRRVKIKYENDCDDTLLPASAPSELGSNSMVFRGTIGANNFTFLNDDGVEFEISGAGGMNSSEGQNFLVSIQIANVIKQIDLSSVASNTIISSGNRVAASGACPTIDLSANNLYECFKKGFEQQAKLGKDSDGSGELEDDEDHVED